MRLYDYITGDKVNRFEASSSSMGAGLKPSWPLVLEYELEVKKKGIPLREHDLGLVRRMYYESDGG